MEVCNVLLISVVHCFEKHPNGADTRDLSPFLMSSTSTSQSLLLLLSLSRSLSLVIIISRFLFYVQNCLSLHVLVVVDVAIVVVDVAIAPSSSSNTCQWRYIAQTEERQRGICTESSLPECGNVVVVVESSRTDLDDVVVDDDATSFSALDVVEIK